MTSSTIKLSDPQLIEQFKKGNAKSFGVLMSKYKSDLFSFIWSKAQNEEFAKDIYQETCIKIMNALKNSKYTDNGKFLSWCFRIAQNEVMNYYRENKKYNFSNSDFSEDKIKNYPVDNDSEKEDKIKKELILKDINKVVDSLPKDQKRIIHLHYYKNMSFKKISAQENISINTLLSRSRYAIKKLQKCEKLQYMSA